MTTCYLPPPTPFERAMFALRSFFHTNRMRWRQFRATFTPLGWSVVLAMWAGVAVAIFVLRAAL